MFKSFSLNIVSYLESFLGASSSLLLSSALNSNSIKIFSSSSSLGVNFNRSLKLSFKSTSSFNDTNATFLSRSFKQFLRFSPTTPVIDSAFFLIPSKSPYSFNHFAAVFWPTFGTPGILSEESPVRASISLT